MSDNPVSMICYACGQLTGIPEYDAQLWDLQERRKDGRQNIEPLVYTQDDLDEAGFYCDDYMRDSVMESMGRNMAERGLCSECGRPDLRAMQLDDFHSEEDIEEMQELWAQEAAERRAGC
jgi:hypothetical protein